MSKVSISAQIDSTLKDQLDKLSQKTEQPSEQLLEQAVAEYIDSQNKKIKAIEEAVEEADKGVFISHDAMSDWLDSWGDKNIEPAPKPDIFLK